MASFPGIYRAKATKVESKVLTAFIPQVFGEAPVTINAFVGTVPTTGGMGWVGFQGGNPEFPVWFGGGLGGGGVGGGGTVTDVLHVGASAPTDTSMELWWDTDAEVPLDPRYPLGVVGYAQTTTTQPSITAIVDLTGLSVTFTATSGRRYKVTAMTRPFSSVAGDNVELTLTTSANVTLQTHNIGMAAGSVAYHQTLVWVSPGTNSGATTWKLRMRRLTGTGTVTNAADPVAPCLIIVEDIGVL